MAYQQNLRFRVFLSYPLLGLLICLLMLIFLLFTEETLERQFMDSFLMEELNYFIEQSNQDPKLVYQKSKNWEIYKVKKDLTPPQINFVTNYTQGTHEIEIKGEMYELGILKKGDTSYYMLFQDRVLHLLMHKLVVYLLAGSFIIILLTTWYGLWLSNKVLEPIISLASEVKSLDPEKTTHKLAHHYAEDEVGILALEFDAYQERLQSLIRREREFTSNASHELRTPLAVIIAASENLLLYEELPEQLQKRILRIKTSAENMSAQLQVLLALSRQLDKETMEPEITYLAPVVEQLLFDYQHLKAPAVTLKSNLDHAVTLKAPHAIVAMVIGNLFKNALIFTDKGTIEITLDQNSISVIDTGCGISSAKIEQIFSRGFKSPESKGSGLGLNIAKRICEHYGWQLSIASQQGLGTQIKWIFLANSPRNETQ